MFPAKRLNNKYKNNSMENEKKVEKSNFLVGIKKFFHEHPFIAWNIFTLISLFIHPLLAVVFFFVSLIFWAKRKEELKKQKHQQMILDAENYVNEVKDKKALPVIKSSIFLEKDENAFLEELTELKETRAIRKYSGGMRGVGFRVAKGVYIGAGGRSGTSESHQEWRTIDRGNLIITNKRLVFNGNKENRTVPLKKIISVDVTLDLIEVAVEARNKTMIFSVKNGYIWGAVMNIVKSVEDPLNLGDLKLDIQFK